VFGNKEKIGSSFPCNILKPWFLGDILILGQIAKRKKLEAPLLFFFSSRGVSLHLEHALKTTSNKPLK